MPGLRSPCDRDQTHEFAELLHDAGLNALERGTAQAAEHAGAREPDHHLVTVDLDQFAMFNDLQGQPAGDEVLKHVAGSIAGSVRDADLVERLGGDEFGVLMPGAGGAEVERVAGRVIDELRRSWPGPALTTVSIGAASGPVRGHSLADLWRSAARALEVARSTGGNQARLARDPVSPEAR